MKKIGVLLVDDHTVVRQGLRALLKVEEDIDVIGEAENGRQAVMLARKTPPDVVVMDVAMPLLNGLEATRQILRFVPTAKVLVLTSYGDDDCVTQLMEAGAAGFLIKQTAANDLLKAIREVQRGNAFFSPAIAKRLRDHGHIAYFAGGCVRDMVRGLEAKDFDIATDATPEAPVRRWRVGCASGAVVAQYAAKVAANTIAAILGPAVLDRLQKEVTAQDKIFKDIMDDTAEGESK